MYLSNSAFVMEPQKLSLWLVKFGMKEKQFKNAYENINECIENKVEMCNCTIKCIPLLYNFLSKYPLCHNEQDYHCMCGSIYYETETFASAWSQFFKFFGPL